VPGIVAGALCAHPPILLTEVGRLESQRVRTTAQAMRELDVLLAGHPADLAIVISPHSPSSMTSLPVRHAAHVAGDLARFRAPQVRVEAIVDTALVTALVGDAQRAGFALTWAEESDLDHGVVVPLYSLPQAMANKRCVFLGVSGWPLARFFAFGAWLHQRLLGRSAILLASGDLSHRLTPDAPYGFRPEGPVFDRLVIDALRDSEWERIEGMDPELIEEAAGRGPRSRPLLEGPQLRGTVWCRIPSRGIYARCRRVRHPGRRAARHRNLPSLAPADRPTATDSSRAPGTVRPLCDLAERSRAAWLRWKSAADGAHRGA